MTHGRPAAQRGGGIGWLSLGLLAALMLAGSARAQGPPVHYLQSSNSPPGTVGRGQLQRGGPLKGYYQPVRLRVPDGVLISVAHGGHFGPSKTESLTAGLLIGSVYRYRVGNIPFYEGLEVYPSIEVVNRLYPPPGHEWRFPIIVDVTAEELEMALNGQFVTRVIYLEDPQRPWPINEDPKRQPYYEVRGDQDPLQVADRLGRPMAILRLGSRVPDRDVNGRFTFGMPPLVMAPELPETLPTPNDKIPIERAARDYPRLPLPRPMSHPGAPTTGAPWLR